MVRHEAAEALGAIGTAECVEALEVHARDGCREVAETCQLALGRIAYWRDRREAEKRGGALGSRKETAFAADPGSPANGASHDAPPDSPYLSVDPVPAAPAGTPCAALRRTLLDEGAAMFERYRALFGLRNAGGCDPALGQVLLLSGSALLKHEVCYVLGQLQAPGAVEALASTLADASQHAMVRHEAAEALGSIAHADCRALLERHAEDPDPVVAQGCEVALDILAYEQSGAFEYCAT